MIKIHSLKKAPVFLLWWLGCSIIFAQSPFLQNEPITENQELQNQINQIAEELRCLVCQNESIASSQAGLAKDLRRELKLQILNGKTDDQIKAYMVERYGDFILYRPQFTTKTLILWLGPFTFLIIGVWLLIFYIKKRNSIISQRLDKSDSMATSEFNQVNQTKIEKLLAD